MALDVQEHHAFEREEGRPPVWIGMAWGVVSLLGGAALLAAMLTFDVREIGWSYLNDSGQVIPGASNVLGVAGLYGAGILYWVLGGMAWMLVILLEWWGLYRLLHHGRLPRSVVYGGLFLLLFGCLFLTAGHVPGDAWVARHQIQGAGGLAGHLLGTGLLLPLTGTSAVLVLSGLGYLLALVYAAGMYPRPLFRAMLREWRAWRMNRKEKRMARQSAQLAREAARVRASMEDAALSAPRPAGRSRASSPRLQRTGDDLEGLYNEVAAASPARPADPAPAPRAPRTQGRLPLTPRPRITVAKPAEIKPAPREQPFSKLSTPPTEEFRDYELPPFELLHYEEKPEGPTEEDKDEMLEIQQKIIDTLTTFRVDVTPGDITRGPTITRYEVYPARGVRVNTFDQYAKDIALATKAESVNIVAPIPGKDTVGIEIVNRNKVAVPLRELLQDPGFCSPKKKIPLALGKDVYGRTVIGDLASMPHLLVAGATGSGKSVCINSIISSMLLKFRPDELRLILVDPKVVEMQPYSKLPHLIVPVVTDPKKVPNALRWCVNEMEHRYHCFAKVGVRNFEAFNKRPPDAPAEEAEEPEDGEADEALAESIARDLESQGEWPAEEDDELDLEDDGVIPERFPYIVIIIDELADLMQTVGADIETNIGRLTQKARAAGIHLIVATQTPRRQVVTGTIKANIPTRIAFQVASGTDSRVILDRQGAEKLVGKGDLLYLPPGSAQVERAQGAFISDDEVEALVAHCASQARQKFHEEVQKSLDEPSRGGADSPLDDAEEECYAKCLEVAVIERKVSTSLLQRRLSIGYGRAARMMDLLESRGIIAPADNTNRPRKVLVE
ncbi:MAG: DNA translocase FtsK 4TM domain-containing protein [Akkermansia sp.]|uniref:FtsK/SpoIIIE family DNA translocase n=1 Tax=Akkermansia sp. TaxID=1872421 RepID=UPI0025C41722|nr:DNA translocase FtsK [Akkermansia sp.]MBS5509250.1 DNA translocase FtsK 4TM domain-containing protein [Akkermansia sp.]